MKKLFRFIGYLSIFIVLFLVTVILAARFTSLQPEDVSEEKVSCPSDTPSLEAGKEYKVLDWNVQYLAGKNYVFFYDLPKGDGPDKRPSTKDIQITAEEIARIIKDEKPDIILLQEVDDGAKRTDYEDQLEKLLKLFPEDYKCHASAFYWKNYYNPHPMIQGSTGMKVSTISRYKISSATRYQLPIIPDNFFVKNFNLKRAVLETKLPLQNGKILSVFNTHLDAFAQGYNTMEEQVLFLKKLLTNADSKKQPWILAGDFNLLPPGFNRESLHKDSISYYNPKTELDILFNSFPSTVSKEELNGENKKAYYTILPNHPEITVPDRTIDYIFYGNIEKRSYSVRQKDTLTISDHLPLIAEFQF
ncbi:MAG: endonuclease/exonuclease/phosphatase family protein [Leptospiraceae bacterium]|nr:endonuclease/exonuclease/phosphatase family protein [Leptospiraceae bacterium]MCP5498898.1 endonuclease/exonuclease/phosphatase family protein [Leptospiraceae bacterium]